MARTDLEWMGLNHKGYGLQNHQNQCSIQDGLMIRIQLVVKKSKIFIEYFLNNKESKKKKKTAGDFEFR